MLPELKIQWLRYAITISDEGGFHAASRRLHRSQPALSMAIKELERHLGQPLFETGGRAELTPFGAYCLPRFRELIAQHDRLSREIVAHRDKQSGQIEVAVVPSVANRIMPGILADFIACHPDLKVSLHDGPADYVHHLVRANEVDLALSSLSHSDDDLDFTPLMHDDIGVVCRDDHAFAGRESLHWKELQGQSLIRNGTSRLLEDTEAEPLLAQSAFFISNMISLTAMLEAGVGITTLPRLAFPEEHQRLRFIPLADPHVERQIGLLRRAGQSLSPAAQAMESFIRQVFDQYGGQDKP